MKYYVIIHFESDASTKIYCTNGEAERDAIFDALRRNANSVQMLHFDNFFVDMSKVIYVIKSDEEEKKKGWFW
jgi:hypothetical protein